MIDVLETATSATPQSRQRKGPNVTPNMEATATRRRWTMDQLERKRQSDRRSQRLIRERNRARMEEMQAELEAFKASDQRLELIQKIEEIRRLKEENMALRKKFKAIEEIMSPTHAHASTDASRDGRDEPNNKDMLPNDDACPLNGDAVEFRQPAKSKTRGMFEASPYGEYFAPDGPQFTDPALMTLFDMDSIQTQAVEFLAPSNLAEASSAGLPMYLEPSTENRVLVQERVDGQTPISTEIFTTTASQTRDASSAVADISKVIITYPNISGPLQTMTSARENALLPACVSGGDFPLGQDMRYIPEGLPSTDGISVVYTMKLSSDMLQVASSYPTRFWFNDWVLAKIKRYQTLSRTDVNSVLPERPCFCSFVSSLGCRRTLAKEIASVSLNCLDIPDLPETAAIYCVFHSLFRLFLNPTEAELLNVPPFARPCLAQATVSHPVWVDFIAWPQIREKLVYDHRMYGTAEIGKAISTNLTVNWKLGFSEMIEFEDAEPRLSKRFHAHIWDINNWSMKDNWGTSFPEFKDCMNILIR